MFGATRARHTKPGDIEREIYYFNPDKDELREYIEELLEQRRYIDSCIEDAIYDMEQAIKALERKRRLPANQRLLLVDRLQESIEAFKGVAEL